MRFCGVPFVRYPQASIPDTAFDRSSSLLQHYGGLSTLRHLLQPGRKNAPRPEYVLPLPSL